LFGNSKLNINALPCQNILEKIGYFFTKYPFGASFDTFLAADTALCVFDDDMFVPQKLDFAYHLLWASVYTLPARRAFCDICPDVSSSDFI
jgi:hypothetical protein